MLYWHFLVMFFFWYLVMFIFVMLSTAIMTAHESKVLSDIHSSSGPSKVGFLGVLQPFADAFKLLLKEYVKPFKSDLAASAASASAAFVIASIFWVLPTISYQSAIYTADFSVLISFLMSLFHVFSILFAGWATGSSYGFLGSMSAAAQLVAYDVVVALVYANLHFTTKEFSFESFQEIQSYTFFLFFYVPFQFVIYYFASLSESSSHPFDFPEAESELVAGFNVEYSSTSFALFFLAEYGIVLYSSILIVILFFSGVLMAAMGFFEFLSWILKIYLMIYAVIHASGLLPSYSYDQLMEICWKCMVPIECAFAIYNVFMQMLL